jgi:hypothetical protein
MLIIRYDCAKVNTGEASRTKGLMRYDTIETDIRSTRREKGAGISYIESEAKKVKDNRKKDRKRREPMGEARGASQPYEEGTATNPRLKALILEVVENQIRASDPPETRQTFERLLAAGYSRKQAMEMIGSALAEEIWGMLHDNKPFDRGRFRGLLEKLG